MNYIVIVVALFVVFILAFFAFVSDDREEDIGYLENEKKRVKEKTEVEIQEEKKPEEQLVEDTKTVSLENNAKNNDIEEDAKFIDDSNSIFQQVSDDEEKQILKTAEITKIHPINRNTENDIPLLEVGNEEDLRLRLELNQAIAKPSSMQRTKCIVANVQFRFPDDVVRNSQDFVKVLFAAEKIFEKEFTFPFETFNNTQFNRILVFEPSEDRDIIIESLIDAYEIIMRFKKSLETYPILKEGKAKIAIGLAAGDMFFINRGVNSEPTLVGKPLYLAETLCEVVGDFGIYVDSNIHNSALPLFNFREWKPTVVRAVLPAIPLFELVGWNKPEEISSYVKHDDSSVRKAVAIAYRYFELEDMHPLVELMADKDRSVVYEAVKTISYIGNDKMNGVLKLRLPEASDPDIKSRIIEAFGNAGNPSVLPVVLASTKESSWKVRVSATKSLYQLGGSDALVHLEAMLKDPDSIVRVVANSIFYKETNKPEYFNELVAGLSDASKRARATAVDCLLAMGTDKALREITNTFANQESDLQKHILYKMLNTKSKILYQCYLTMFKHSNESLRPYIVEAVRRAGIVS